LYKRLNTTIAGNLRTKSGDFIVISIISDPTNNF
jgi:hypothetical protein